MKLNITRILSLSVLLLLPAFAAAGQRKAVRKAALPKLASDGSTFRAFNKPAAGAASTTTQDAAEDSNTEGNSAQSTGGAGLSMGVAVNPGSSKGSLGVVGAAPGKSAGGRAASSAPAPSIPSGCRVITSGPGSTEDSLPRQVVMDRGEMFAFEFTVGDYSAPISIGTGYAAAMSPDGGYGLSQHLSLSQNPCDFSQKLDAAGCAIYRDQDSFFYYYKDDVWYDAQNRPNRGFCKVTPGKTYYFNVANVTSNGVDSCKPGFTCAYTIFHGGGRQIKQGNSAAAPTPVAESVCVPPPAMAAAEKIEWFCSQPGNQGPNCQVKAKTLLPYISDYAKYPGLDVRGCPCTATNPCL